MEVAAATPARRPCPCPGLGGGGGGPEPGEGRILESWGVWGMEKAGKLPAGPQGTGSLLNPGWRVTRAVASLKPVVKKVMN